MMINDDHNTFGHLLRTNREYVGKKVCDVATEAGIDRAYLYRLEAQPHDWLNRPLNSAPAKQPSRDVVIRLGIALDLSIDRVDELLIAAGYRPLMLLR